MLNVLRSTVFSIAGCPKTTQAFFLIIIKKTFVASKVQLARCKPNTKPQMDLLDKTKKLLKGRNLTMLSETTGYSYQWLWKVREGKITNPSVSRIETLYKHLNELPSASNTR